MASKVSTTGGASRPASRSRRHEFFEDTASSSSSSSSSSMALLPQSLPVPSASATALEKSADVPLTRSASGRSASAAAPPPLHSVQRVVQRQDALAALATAAQNTRQRPGRGPSPVTRALLPSQTTTMALSDRKVNLDRTSGAQTTTPPPPPPTRPLTTLLVETGRRAMEQELLHWRRRCGSLEAQLLSAVSALDAARATAITSATEPAPWAATASPPTVVVPTDSDEAAVVADAQHWRAIAKAFLQGPTAPHGVAVDNTPSPRRPPAPMTTAAPPQPQPVMATSLPQGTSAERSPSRWEWGARSLSPTTPASHAYEMLLSASPAVSAPTPSSPPLAPPPPPVPIIRQAAPLTATVAADSETSVSMAESGKEEEHGAATQRSAPRDSSQTSPDSQELVYDVSAGAAAMTAPERAKATAALDALRQTQGAVAPTAAPTAVVTPPSPRAAASAQEERTAMTEALRRAEADLAAARMDRDDLETTLLSTREQLAQLQEEAATATAATAQPSMDVWVELVHKLRDTTRFIAGGEDANLPGHESDALADGDASTFASTDSAKWRSLLARESQQLRDAAETQRLQLMELKEELHVVREDRNELVGQQSEQVRRLQQRLLEREKDNVRLTDALALRDEQVVALTRDKTKAEEALDAHNTGADTARIADLTAQLAEAKAALQVKETALRIALRESIQTSMDASPPPQRMPTEEDTTDNQLGRDARDSPARVSPTTARAESWSPMPLRERSQPNVVAAAAGGGAGRAASLGSSAVKRASALPALLVTSPKDANDVTLTRAWESAVGAAASSPLRHSPPSAHASHRSRSQSQSSRGGGGGSPHFASPTRSNASTATMERLARTIRAANEDVMERHRALWHQQEMQYGIDGGNFDRSHLSSPGSGGKPASV